MDKLKSDKIEDEKIGESGEDLEVESEEKERGKDIEIDEERLPSRAMAIHEHIRQDGEKEMERDAMALLWSAIAAGLSMGASLLGKGIFHVHLEGVPGGFLLENFGYTLGFIIVIMARQQLFTENTVTAVLPVMQNPTRSNFLLLLRLWSIVLLGNLIGTGLAALAFEFMPIFDEPTRDAFVTIGTKVCECHCFRLADCHHGLDVSGGWPGENRGDHYHDLDYRPGRHDAYCGGHRGDPVSGV